MTLGALYTTLTQHNELCSSYSQQILSSLLLSSPRSVYRCQRGFGNFSPGPPCCWTLPAAMGTVSPSSGMWSHGIVRLEQPWEPICSHSAAKATTTNFHTPTFTFPHTQEVTRCLLIRDYTSSIILMPAAGYFCLNPNLTIVLPHHQPVFRPRLITHFSLLSHTCSILSVHGLFCPFSDE